MAATILATAATAFALTSPTAAGSATGDTTVEAGAPSVQGPRADRGNRADRGDRQAPAPSRRTAAPSTTVPQPAPSPAGTQTPQRPTAEAPAPSTAPGTASSIAPSPAPLESPATAGSSSAGTAAGTAPTATTADAARPTHRSGLSWSSGVYVPGSSARSYDAFGAWRGQSLDVVVDWAPRQTWSDIVNPTWLYDAWAGTPYTKVLGVAMVPEGDGSATIASCASGAHDAQWREFGSNIAAAGLADESIIRLGWEFNGDWYKWTASNPAAWVQCWRRIVTAAESVAPALRWDWTVNRGVSAGLADATRAYPGDAYVDIVGVDSYDMWPGVRSEADWKQHLDGDYGLRFWADFATSHGKLLSVPEWGVYPGTAQAGHNGGDNGLYITKMVEFFASMGSRLAYEAYFNEPAGYYAGSLFGPTQNPQAAAAYQRLYSAGG